MTPLRAGPARWRAWSPVKRALIIAYVWMLIVTVGVSVALIREQAEREASHRANVEQKFDAAFRSCEGVNRRHRAASRVVARDPRSVKAIAGPLLAAAVPLRDGQHGSLTCTQYASRVLNPPPPAATATEGH